jgi:hypothetical protein
MHSWDMKNLDLNIVDYPHVAIFFYHAIKQNYCINNLPIDKTSRDNATMAEQHYVEVFDWS